MTTCRPFHSIEQLDGSDVSGERLVARTSNSRLTTCASSSLFYVCPDVLVHVCAYLDALELAHLSATCHPLRSLLIVCDAVVWRALCVQLWRDKQGFRRFCDHVDITTSVHASDASRHILTSGSSEASLSSLGGSPKRCRHVKGRHSGVPAAPTLSPGTTLRCIRDAILPAATQLKNVPPAPLALPPSALPRSSFTPVTHVRRLWWELSPHEQLRRLRRILQSTSSEFADGTTTASTTDSSSSSEDDDIRQSTVDGGDLHSETTWKFAYFMSLRDSKRKALTASDLYHSEWSITFRQIPDRKFPLTFDKTGMLQTPLHPQGLRFQLSQQGEEMNIHVFPALHVTRANAIEDVARLQGIDQKAQRASWGWCIQNHFVTILSEDVPIPLYLQHLHRLSSPRPP